MASYSRCKREVRLGAKSFFMAHESIQPSRAARAFVSAARLFPGQWHAPLIENKKYVPFLDDQVRGASPLRERPTAGQIDRVSAYKRTPFVIKNSTHAARTLNAVSFLSIVFCSKSQRPFERLKTPEDFSRQKTCNILRHLK